MKPSEVVAKLNSIIGEGPAWCDGGSYDRHCAHILGQASEVAPVYKVEDWDLLSGGFDTVEYMRMVRWLDRAPPRHRAKHDAERLLKALARGLKIENGTAVDLFHQ